jgi:hypothetical protein
MSAVLSHLMLAQADIVLESATRHRLLLVECKWARELSPESAASFRQRLSRRWDLDAPFFMLAFTGALYLWRKETPSDALPDFSASPDSIWRAYIANVARMRPEGILEECVVLAVGAWLNDLAWGHRRLNPRSKADQMLVRSGLYEQMWHGIIRREDPDL